MMDFENFKNLHHAETCLLVGNGENLYLTPPQVFPYPSIGMNTIHLYEGWMPNYYMTVDHRVYREFGKVIAERFKAIPKFVPSLKLDEWQGENFIRFSQRTRDEIKLDDLQAGLSGSNVMHFAMQLAYWMGFTTLLLIGVQHKPDHAKAHFWGWDDGIRNPAPLNKWFADYRFLVEEMRKRGVQVLNISQDTYVPQEIIPRDNWSNYES